MKTTKVDEVVLVSTFDFTAETAGILAHKLGKLVICLPSKVDNIEQAFNSISVAQAKEILKSIIEDSDPS